MCSYVSIECFSVLVHTYCVSIGPSNPATPVNPRVYGTGADFAIVQWTVSRVEFTPETYYIEYSKFTEEESDADLIRKQYPMVNANFTATDAVFTFVVDGLGPDRGYGFKIVAENSNGETSTEDFVLASTRNQGLHQLPMCTEKVSLLNLRCRSILNSAARRRDLILLSYWSSHRLAVHPNKHFSRRKW